ncbi:MAG: hypothetical protein ACHQUC_02760 [Chlamydiales bacterium]
MKKLLLLTMFILFSSFCQAQQNSTIAFGDVGSTAPIIIPNTLQILPLNPLGIASSNVVSSASLGFTAGGIAFQPNTLSSTLSPQIGFCYSFAIDNGSGITAALYWTQTSSGNLNLIPSTSVSFFGPTNSFSNSGNIDLTTLSSFMPGLPFVIYLQMQVTFPVPGSASASLVDLSVSYVSPQSTKAAYGTLGISASSRGSGDLVLTAIIPPYANVLTSSSPSLGGFPGLGIAFPAGTLSGKSSIYIDYYFNIPSTTVQLFWSQSPSALRQPINGTRSSTNPKTGLQEYQGIINVNHLTGFNQSLPLVLFPSASGGQANEDFYMNVSNIPPS